MHNRNVLRRLVGLIRHPGQIRSVVRRRIGTQPKDPRREADSSTAAPSERPSIAPRRFPELQIGKLGSADAFDDMLSTADPTQPSDGVHYDLLILDLSPDETIDAHLRSLAELDGVPLIVIARAPHHLEGARIAGIPNVLDAAIDLIVGDDERPDILLPSVNPGKHNPVGWNRSPTDDLAVVVSSDSDASNHLLTEPYEARITRVQNGDLDAGFMSRFRAAFVFRVDFASEVEYLRTLLRVAAMGTPVLTHPSDTVGELIGDYLPVNTHDEVEAALALLADDFDRERISIRSRRHVLMHHTPIHRFESILDRLGLRRDPPDMVSVLAATKRPDQVPSLIESFSKQAWPSKELILILHGDDHFDLHAVRSAASAIPSITEVVPCSTEMTLGECLNAGLRFARGPYVSKMDDDDHYGPMHLADLMVAASYADASAVGKLANPTQLSEMGITVDWRIGDQERFVHHLPGATMLIRKEMLDRYRFNRVNRAVDSALWARMAADGHKIYSTHWLNFVRVRHDDNTYRRPESDFVGLSSMRSDALTPEDWFA